METAHTKLSANSKTMGSNMPTCKSDKGTFEYFYLPSELPPNHTWQSFDDMVYNLGLKIMKRYPNTNMDSFWFVPDTYIVMGKTGAEVYNVEAFYEHFTIFDDPFTKQTEEPKKEESFAIELRQLLTKYKTNPEFIKNKVDFAIFEAVDSVMDTADTSHTEFMDWLGQNLR